MPTVDQDILEELQKLRAEHEALVRQRRELDAAIARVVARIPGHDPGSWMGSLKHVPIDLTYDDFREARREAWGLSEKEQEGNSAE